MDTEEASRSRWIPRPRHPGGEEPYRHRWVALVAVALGVFLVALDITIVGVTGPSLSDGLGATASQIQWAFDAYTVVLAGFVVLGAALAERLGRKGIMQLGLLVFAIGSTLSGFAHTPMVLIVGRMVAGLGAAFLFPSSLSILSALFPPAEHQRAVGIYASISALGLAGGPVVGGLLIQKFWWGAAFLCVVPIALFAIMVIGVIVPPSRQPQKGNVDVLGALLSILGLGGFVFAVIEGPNVGWGTPIVYVPFVAGLAGTIGFILWELRCRAPLFDLHVFKDTRVVGGALAMATVYFTFNSSQLLLPQYLDYVLNFSSLHTGLAMCPFGLGLVLLSPRSGRLIERYGQRAMLLFSLTFMAAGLVVLALLPYWGGVSNVLAGTAIYSVGFGLIVAPATSIIMTSVPRDQAGDGSAVNMISRQVGGAVGVAITGSIASMVYRSGLSLDSFDLSVVSRMNVERSMSGVIALQHDLDPAVSGHLDAMADLGMLKGVAVAMGLSALVTVLVAGIGYFSLSRKVDVPK